MPPITALNHLDYQEAGEQLWGAGRQVGGPTKDRKELLGVMNMFCGSGHTGVDQCPNLSTCTL